MNRFTYHTAADSLDLPERTIRFWVTEGLIIKPLLSDGRRKFFTKSQYEELDAIKWFLKNHKQTIADLQAVRKIIIDKLGDCDAAKLPLQKLKNSILGGVCAFTPALLKSVIDDFLKGKYWLEAFSDGNVLLRGDFSRFKDDFQEYRYGQKLEAVEIPEGYFEENEGVFIRFDELDKHFLSEYELLNDYKPGSIADPESKAKEDATGIEAMIREGLLDPPHYQRQGLLFMLSDELELAGRWSNLIHQADFKTLRNLREAIETDIQRQFPYDLTSSGYRPFYSCMLPEIRQFCMEINLVKKILDALIKNCIQDSCTIELYMNGLLSVHHKTCSTCLSFEVYLAKTSLSDLEPEQLRNAEKIGLYDAEAVGMEAESRINQNRKEIDFLRYKVLKNLNRRKK